MTTTESIATQPGKHEMWATFRLGSEIFALRVDEVQEVLMNQPLTPVPKAPAYLVGLLNLRGQIVPAIDVRRRLAFPPRDDAESTSLVVLRHAGDLYGLVVDEIGDVLELEADAWRKPPPTLPAEHVPFVRAMCPVEGEIVLGLRAERLTDDPRSRAEET